MAASCDIEVVVMFCVGVGVARSPTLMVVDEVILNDTVVLWHVMVTLSPLCDDVFHESFNNTIKRKGRY